jgi:hypothetical protein
MSRKRRRKPVDPRIARLMPENPGWKWRTLPVYLAITGGFLLGYRIASFGAGVSPDRWAFAIDTAVLIAFGLGLARISRWLTERWVVRRRIQRRLEEAPDVTPRQRRRREQSTPTTPPT